MVTAREEGREEGREKGREEGRLEEKIKMARNAIELGLPIETVSKNSGLSAKDIENL